MELFDTGEKGDRGDFTLKVKLDFTEIDSDTPVGIDDIFMSSMAMRMIQIKSFLTFAKDKDKLLASRTLVAGAQPH